MKVSQKPLRADTLTGLLLLVSRSLRHGREHIILGTPVLQLSLNSWHRAVLTRVLFRGVRLRTHKDPVCSHFWQKKKPTKNSGTVLGTSKRILFGDSFRRERTCKRVMALSHACYHTSTYLQTLDTWDNSKFIYSTTLLNLFNLLSQSLQRVPPHPALKPHTLCSISSKNSLCWEREMQSDSWPGNHSWIFQINRYKSSTFHSRRSLCHLVGELEIGIEEQNACA